MMLARFCLFASFFVFSLCQNFVHVLPIFYRDVLFLNINLWGIIYIFQTLICPDYSMEGLMLKLRNFGHLMWKTDSLEKTLMLGKIEGGRRRGQQEEDMVEWHHRLDSHKSEQAPGVGDGQRSLACYSPWSLKESQLSDWTDWPKLCLN